MVEVGASICAGASRKHMREEYSRDDDRRIAHILTPTPLTHARTNTPAQTLGGKAGKGAFSVVRSGRDLERESQVAIKRVQDATEDLTYLRRLLREVALLRRLRG